MTLNQWKNFPPKPFDFAASYKKGGSRSCIPYNWKFFLFHFRPSGENLKAEKKTIIIPIYTARCVEGKFFVLRLGKLLSSAPAKVQLQIVENYQAEFDCAQHDQTSLVDSSKTLYWPEEPDDNHPVSGKPEGGLTLVDNWPAVEGLDDARPG